MSDNAIPMHLLLKADARSIPLSSGSVQCVVTSPPYFAVRDYGVAGQIGLEPTLADYIAEIVKVFREVRRVLRDDGTVFLNIGDTYCNAGTHNNGTGLDGKRRGGVSDTDGTWVDAKETYRDIRGGFPDLGIKRKDRMGVPHRVVFALQLDGWYWRDEIVWAKPAPMPESVTDRCTKAHEFMFLLTKSDRYHFDHEAIKEAGSNRAPGNISHKHEDARLAGDLKHQTKANLTKIGPVESRNCRSVWTINTVGFPGAHFATMPPKLAERCIKAGSQVGGIVLDPFNGSGTTGSVATGLGRRYIGLDLNPEYLAMARRRIERPHAPVARVFDEPSFPLFTESA